MDGARKLKSHFYSFCCPSFCSSSGISSFATVINLTGQAKSRRKGESTSSHTNRKVTNLTLPHPNQQRSSSHGDRLATVRINRPFYQLRATSFQGCLRAVCIDAPWLALRWLELRCRYSPSEWEEIPPENSETSPDWEVLWFKCLSFLWVCA